MISNSEIRNRGNSSMTYEQYVYLFQKMPETPKLRPKEADLDDISEIFLNNLSSPSPKILQTFLLMTYMQSTPRKPQKQQSAHPSWQTPKQPVTNKVNFQLPQTKTPIEQQCHYPLSQIGVKKSLSNQSEKRSKSKSLSHDDKHVNKREHTILKALQRHCIEEMDHQQQKQQ